MLTLFTIPKPFEGHIGLIQRNALANWRRLAPAAEVVLLGRDAGVADAAREFGAHHEPEIAVNSHGTPLITDAFARVRAFSRRPVLMYSNADMLYDRTLLAALDAVKFPAFLLSGQRWDLDIQNDLSVASDPEWERLFSSRTEQGRLHGAAGMDYFVFPRDLDLRMPQFAVGRVGWDSWLVWSCRQRGLPVVNATRSITAIHQNHSYASLKLGYQHWRGPERDLNIRAAGGLGHLLTLREASHEMDGGQLRRPAGWRAVSARLALFPSYCWGLGVKRWLQQKFY